MKKAVEFMRSDSFKVKFFNYKSEKTVFIDLVFYDDNSIRFAVCSDSSQSRLRKIRFSFMDLGSSSMVAAFKKSLFALSSHGQFLLLLRFFPFVTSEFVEYVELPS